MAPLPAEAVGKEWGDVRGQQQRRTEKLLVLVMVVVQEQTESEQVELAAVGREVQRDDLPQAEAAARRCGRALVEAPTTAGCHRQR